MRSVLAAGNGGFSWAREERMRDAPDLMCNWLIRVLVVLGFVSSFSLCLMRRDYHACAQVPGNHVVRFVSSVGFV